MALINGKGLAVNKTNVIIATFAKYSSYYSYKYNKVITCMLLLHPRNANTGKSVGTHVWVSLHEDDFIGDSLEKVFSGLREGDELRLRCRVISYNKHSRHRITSPNKLSLTDIVVESVYARCS